MPSLRPVPKLTTVQVTIPDREPEAKQGPELKTLEGSVIGYRGWRVSDWRLLGTGMSIAWKPGINEAKCGLGIGHVAPHDGCLCGMYALARFDDETSWWTGADVIGAVEAWADPDEDNRDGFFVHATGFRSQYAKVILLATSDDYPRAKNGAIRALAAEHSADVCKREHLEDAAKEHGQLVPDEWLEWADDGEPGMSRMVAAMQNLSQMMRATSMSMHQAVQAMSVAAAPTPVANPASRRKIRGIKATLKTAGPPFLGKWREGDVVRDRRRDLWVCTGSGTPGSWEKV